MKSKNLFGVLFFVLLFSSTAWSQQSCVNYLKTSSKLTGAFLEREAFAPLQLFTNPSRDWLSQESQIFPLTLEAVKTRSMHEAERLENVYEVSQTYVARPELQFNRQEAQGLLGMDYVLIRSEAQLQNLLRARGFPKTAAAKELELAREILKNEPGSELLITDLGITLWKQNQLRRWWTDYAQYSLSPARMQEFIYRRSLDSTGLVSVSESMAMRSRQQLDLFKNMELAERASIDMFSQGFEPGALSWVYRSLFRETLIQKRLELLEAIGKKTELSQLSRSQQEEAISVLARFPEFLYKPEAVQKAKFAFGEPLVDGGYVFRSAVTPMLGLTGFYVQFLAYRTVELGFGLEALHTNIQITKRFSSQTQAQKLTIQDAVKVRTELMNQWQQMLDTGIYGNFRSRMDLKIEVINNQSETPHLSVLSHPVISQQGLEPYMMWDLYSRF